MDRGSLSQFPWDFGSGKLFSALADVAGHGPSGLDMSIEGMRSQQFSIGVFVFMLVGVAVFLGMIYFVAFGKTASKTLKPGEKVMVGAVIAGTLLAVIFGGLQLVGGDLF